MIHSVLLFLHISGGAMGILSGMAALIPRKGSRLHITIGRVFFYSMIVMTVSASYMAISQGSWINSVAGLLTFYMVMTSRRAAVNKSGKNGVMEYAGMIYILTILVILIVLILDVSQTGPKDDGVYVEAYYMFGVIATLAFSLDLKVVIKGGVYGAQRIARHLWRMCFALYTATASFFLGQPQVFPDFVTEVMRLVPVIITILVLLIWVIRVYFVRRFKTVQARQ